MNWKRSIASCSVAVLSVALLSVGAAPSAVAGNGDYSPITTEDGKQRRDVFLAQTTESDRFIVQNESDQTIRVDYSDPTYGPQSVVVAPHTESSGTKMCADETYRDTNLVTVTYIDTSTVGTGKYSVWTDDRQAVYTMDLAKAKKSFAKAKKNLAKAKRHHHLAAVKRWQRVLKKAKSTLVRARYEVRQARRRLESLRREFAFCLDQSD